MVEGAVRRPVPSNGVVGPKWRTSLQDYLLPLAESDPDLAEWIEQGGSALGLLPDEWETWGSPIASRQAGRPFTWEGVRVEPFCSGYRVGATCSTFLMSTTCRDGTHALGAWHPATPEIRDEAIWLLLGDDVD
jgi:hypothetical protein